MYKSHVSRIKLSHGFEFSLIQIISAVQLPQFIETCILYMSFTAGIFTVNAFALTW